MNDLTLLKWARDADIKQHCRYKLRIAQYEPFHIRYQFGHYPTRTPYTPGKADWQLLDLYQAWGGGVIHLWYWNEWCGLFGKSPFEAINETGTIKFIEEAHKRGLKVIPYVSPGYLDTQNVIHNPKWSRNAKHLVELANDFDRLCPGSTSWREYFFDNLAKMIDHYKFDGIYWDGGIGPHAPGCNNPEADDHVHFVNNDPKDPDSYTPEAKAGYYDLWEDFLAEMYCIVKARNGIVVAHVGGDQPQPFERPWWDYYLLGEGVPDLLASINRTRDYAPYVLRFNDWSKLVTADWENGDLTPDVSKVAPLEHLAMAASIVYLQFPWLEDGSYGEIEDMFSIPGTEWKCETQYDHWSAWMKAQGKAGLAPLGNASWIAGRDRHGDYLKIYRKMTKNNSVTFIEIADEPQLPFPGSSEKRRVSVFINESLWLAIANMNSDSETVAIKSLDGSSSKTINLPAERLTVLQYNNTCDLPATVEITNKTGTSNIQH
ncbi:MAG: hypothetical protein L3J71_07940 [Victivallaceae bacterium]|nr:hypothetical protein [Victivallaceae bacterium]